MELADGIRRLGFRRWYERQLIESHLYLVTCLLAAVVVFACAEGLSLRGAPLEALARVGLMAAGGGVAVWSLVRYLMMLRVATVAAERSVCARCSTYGRLDVTSVRGEPPGAKAGLAITPVRVRCRQCGNEWMIE